MCNFADDTASYPCDKPIDTVIMKLAGDLQQVLDWFKENGKFADPAKFQMIVSKETNPFASTPMVKNKT